MKQASEAKEMAMKYQEQKELQLKEKTIEWVETKCNAYIEQASANGKLGVYVCIPYNVCRITATEHLRKNGYKVNRHFHITWE